ncbi:MAG: aldehyde dehydrogenase family protein [Candidatus Calescibacterium sp.]|nr:aldehyde dehydrogenase family protein [Candidatus Calescibacterium sp.]MDW8132899.1 aldehyde dehydrogenase family protein [Candidatus Calescibacterium sp.]
MNKKKTQNPEENAIRYTTPQVEYEIESIIQKSLQTTSKDIPDLKFFGIWDYSQSIEDNSYIKFKESYDLFIGGKFVKPTAGRYFPTINPANEEILTYVAYATEEDVNKAVESAKTAYEKYWSKLKPKDRAKYIYKIARIIQERSRELAIIETMDNGKAIKETRDFDIPQTAQHFFYYAGWADKLEYAFVNRKFSPIGVVGQIIPWNFPLLMAAWKIAPALACGNTVVLKPAETTPLTALILAEIIQEAGLPDGVVNIITGDGYTGSLIVKHPDIKKIAFTGSTEVGKIIIKTAKNKKVTLELGGKGPHIILEDSPIDQAIEAIIKGIYFNQGHVCCAGSRLLVQESILDTVIQKLKDRMKTIRIGNPLDKNTDMGAINSSTQLEKIKSYTEIGKKEGCIIYQQECKLPDKGYWFPPTFFTNVSQSCTIAKEEIFGPVLSIMTFRDPQEAIEIANNTFYGLSAGIWTNNPARLLEMSKRIRAGVIWANTYNQFDPASPFGGYKESGFGREGGWHGLLPYIELH